MRLSLSSGGGETQPGTLREARPMPARGKTNFMANVQSLIFSAFHRLCSLNL